MPSKLPTTKRSLPIALIRAREGVMTPIRSMLAGPGITEQQWRVLRVLSEYGAMDTSSLATQSALLFPSLTRIANSMREKGLLTQTRDKIDRRRQVVEITAKGQSIIDDNAGKAAEIVKQYQDTLGSEKYEQLLDLLELLTVSKKT